MAESTEVTEVIGAIIVTTVRLPAHIHAAMTKAAEVNRRSFNSQVVTALENDLASASSKAKASK